MSVERIDTLEFTTAINAMNDAIRHFQSARRSIVRATDPVVDSWEGKGAKAFKKVYKKLKTELEDEETNLTTVKQDMETIRTTYEDWDSQMGAAYAGNGK